MEGFEEVICKTQCIKLNSKLIIYILSRKGEYNIGHGHNMELDHFILVMFIHVIKGKI